MPQNSEQIEAKLCAFLEGELDEQGLADIEKHLQANPSHRKLLAEVGKTRGLLRALPRESAPPDICEAFQSQLERSVLLADLDEDGAESATQTSGWQQHLAVAAVVMLAAGLGLFVYFGLPWGGIGDRFVVAPAGQGGALEQDDPSTRSAAAPSDLLRSDEEAVTDLSPLSAPPAASATAPATSPISPRAEAMDAARLALRGAQAGGASGVTVLSQKATSAPAAAAQELSAIAQRVQGAWETRARERFFASDAAADVNRAQALVPPGTTYLVFSSAEPTVAADRIGRELGRLQVAWSVLPTLPAAPVRSKLYGGGAMDAGDSVPVQSEVTGRGVAEDESGPARVPAPPDDLAQAALALPDAHSPAGTARGATTRPVAESTEPADDPPVPLTKEGMRPMVGGLAEGMAGTETLIVARGLTREQADSLREAIEAPDLEPRITLQSAGVQGFPGIAQPTPGAAGKAGVDGRVPDEVTTLPSRPFSAAALPEAASRPTTAGVGGDAEKIDVMIVVRSEGLAPGQVPPPQTMPAEPTGPIEKFEILTIQVGNDESDSANVRVAEDGTIELPRIGRLQAEGLTSPQLENEIVAKLKPPDTAWQGGPVRVHRIRDDAAATTSPALSEPSPPLSPPEQSDNDDPVPIPESEPK